MPGHSGGRPCGAPETLFRFTFFGCFMLQQMRKGAASWVAKGLMLLLVLSFGLWGIGDYVANYGTGDPVAKVGDAETDAVWS